MGNSSSNSRHEERQQHQHHALPPPAYQYPPPPSGPAPGPPTQQQPYNPYAQTRVYPPPPTVSSCSARAWVRETRVTDMHQAGPRHTLRARLQGYSGYTGYSGGQYYGQYGGTYSPYQVCTLADCVHVPSPVTQLPLTPYACMHACTAAAAAVKLPAALHARSVWAATAAWQRRG